jgi:phosphate transport system protein
VSRVSSTELDASRCLIHTKSHKQPSYRRNGTEAVSAAARTHYSLLSETIVTLSPAALLPKLHVLSCRMRTAFHEQLDALASLLGEMCGSAGTAMERATDALLQADLLRAEQVITDHERLVEMKCRAEETAFVLLALQSPVAGDLRVIVGCMQNVTDAERMGGLALHVAKIARRRHPMHTLPEEVNGYFAEMGRIAVDLGRAAREVVLTSDPQMAAQIRLDDDAMDDLHRHLFTILMDKEWKHGVASAVDATLLGRFYERFADHAVEIGRRVVFQATGR